MPSNAREPITTLYAKRYKKSDRTPIFPIPKKIAMLSESMAVVNLKREYSRLRSYTFCLCLRLSAETAPKAPTVSRPSTEPVSGTGLAGPVDGNDAAPKI